MFVDSTQEMNTPKEDSRFAQCQRTDSEIKRSRAQPLPKSHVARTQSELQLSEDMAAAEWQDLCMFYRVVGGIREQQQKQCSRRHGAPIQVQRGPQHEDEFQPQKPVRDWTGKEVSSAVDAAARVTPLDSCSPQDYQKTLLPYPKSLLLKSPQRRSSDSGWSITGFDEDPQDASPLALIRQDSCDDEAIFVMDL